MKLRSHLQILILGTVLPVVIFGIGATLLIAERERELVRRGGEERTLALLTAVDAELDGYLESLQALAGSSALSDGDLRAFHGEASRALRIQPGWRSIRLARPDGTVVLDARLPFGEAVDAVRESPSFDAALRERRPVIRDLYPEPDGSYLFGVRTPVLQGDSVRWVLSALVDPTEIAQLLTRQRMESDWVGVVLDAQHRIVARTVASDETVGRLASTSLRSALAQRSEGWFQGETLEGLEVYTPYTQSAHTGWTVAIGIPRDRLDTGAAEIGWLFAAGVLAAVLSALVLASALSRRIVRPIDALATAARALGRGQKVEPPVRAGVREVREVSRVLARAASDVGEREAALRNADRAKDEFLAMLGHELRNPLSALTSASEVLRMKLPATDPSAPVDRALDVLDRQLRHMTRLVDDLLDVSRVTTGKVKLELEPLDLAAAVADVVETFDGAGRLADHRFGADLAPAWVRADRSRVEQIVANLLGNAVKYTPAGGDIRVRVGRRGEDAVLEVEDSGAGMPPELTERVFLSFVQGERSLDREAGGLGLGLTLVKSLVERHGGSVEAASGGPGAGSLFTVRLPAIEAPALSPSTTEGAAELAAEPAAEPARPRSTTRDAGSSGRRILVVDDNGDVRDALTAALEDYGHDVDVAADGAGALTAVRRRRPDVTILDVGLPGMDGFEVARRLRREHGAALPILGLTGYSHEETRTRAARAGFDRMLTKPVAVEELARLIADVTGGRTDG